MTADYGQQLGIQGMYGKRGVEGGFGPSTYTNAGFQLKIFDALDISGSERALDLMSGPGLLGEGLQKLAVTVRWSYLDLVSSQLGRIPLTRHRIAGDARRTPFKNSSFDRIVIRYAAKDIPQELQQALFVEANRIMEQGGVLVLADMISPVTGESEADQEIYDFTNKQHRKKQEKSGRDEAREGLCHIPTELGWLQLLEQSGFRAEVFGKHMSYVTTTEWLRSNQIDQLGLEEMNRLLLGAPTAARLALNIREKEGLVEVAYPVTIIRAIKI